MSLTRRGLLRAGSGLLVAGAAAGGLTGLANLGITAATGASPAPGRDRPLRIGYLPITDASPLLVAHGHGLYGEHDLDVAQPVLFRSWAGLAEAFLTRQVDVVHMLMPMALQLRATVDPGARVLAWNHTSGSALTVAPQVSDLAQLAGQQVAIPGWWSIHNIVLQRMLRGAGLEPVIRRGASARAGTVELIVMSPSDMVPALAGGSIAGYTVADPFNAAAEARGIGRIHRFLGDVWRDHACCVLLTHDELIDARPGAVQALTDSVLAGQQAIVADRAGAAATLTEMSYLPQPGPVVARALNQPADAHAVAHPAWDPHLIGFAPFPFPSFTEALVENMHATVVDGDRTFLDRLDPAAVHGALVDDRFVRTALERTGGAAAWGLPADLTRTEEIAV
ncbi:ABC transporter substrate-binding protein [Georgenia sp. M64]|uniref:ABC transporter substrate-binding protein n=1 Tax=Georgenia sp. M64 TaxID=3120520 RepID=UPI0030E2A633